MYFKTHKYTEYLLSLSNIKTALENNTVNKGVLRFLSDYYEINIIVLDYNTEKYLIGKEYDEEINEKNVIVIKNEGIYIPLVNMFGDMPTKVLFKCIVNKLQIDKECYNEPPKQEHSNTINNIKSLKAISSYKLKELQDMAGQHNIKLTIDNSGKQKNKTKQALYTEIKNLQ